MKITDKTSLKSMHTYLSSLEDSEYVAVIQDLLVGYPFVDDGSDIITRYFNKYKQSAVRIVPLLKKQEQEKLAQIETEVEKNPPLTDEEQLEFKTLFPKLNIVKIMALYKQQIEKYSWQDFVCQIKTMQQESFN